MQKALDIDLDAHLSNPDWRLRATCRGSHPDLFHPRRGEPLDMPRTMCAVCPVSEPCLSFALVNFEKVGVWGGTSEKERRVMRGTLIKAGRLQRPVTDDDL